jgi:hypothetical protein
MIGIGFRDKEGLEKLIKKNEGYMKLGELIGVDFLNKRLGLKVFLCLILSIGIMFFCILFLCSTRGTYKLGIILKGLALQGEP